MSVDIKIPQPPGIFRVEDVGHAMTTHTPVQFEQFKKCIRAQASQILDVDHIAKDQDPDKWNKFLQRIVAVHPDIDVYANLWPVMMYYNKWVYNTRGSRMAAPRNDRKKSPSRESGVGTSPTSTPKKTPSKPSMFIGKPPPRRLRLLEKNDHARRSFTEAIGSQEIPSTSSTPSQALTTMSATSLGAASAMATLSVDASSITQNTRVNYPTACVYCGYLPEIPPACTIELRRLLDSSSLLHILQTQYGITHDHHLQIFLSLSREERIDFINARQDNESFTRLDKAILIKYIAGQFGCRQLKRTDQSELFLSPIRSTSSVAGEDRRTTCSSPLETHSKLRPAIAWADCPTCPTPNMKRISSKLESVLYAHGLEELLPAFVSIGVRSDDNLRDFCSLDQTTRLRLFNDTGLIKLHLSSFQSVMLKLASVLLDQE